MKSKTTFFMLVAICVIGFSGCSLLPDKSDEQEKLTPPNAYSPPLESGSFRFQTEYLGGSGATTDTTMGYAGWVSISPSNSLSGDDTYVFLGPRQSQRTRKNTLNITFDGEAKPGTYKLKKTQDQYASSAKLSAVYYRDIQPDLDSSNGQYSLYEGELIVSSSSDNKLKGGFHFRMSTDALSGTKTIVVRGRFHAVRDSALYDNSHLVN